MFAFLLAVEAVVVPAALVLFNIDVARHGLGLLAIALAATPGIAAAGALFGVMTVHTRARDLVLEARVRTDAGTANERPLVDVLLEDGRWLRMRTLPGGELLLEDLAAGQADVRVVP